MIPRSLQAVLWSIPIEQLDLQKNKNYIVHQILAYGRWEHIQWLLKTYPKSEIIAEFVTRPAKDYWPSGFNFIKNYILKIPDILDQNKYDRTTPRIIG